MVNVSTKPLSGMRDFLPADLARRNYVIEVVREVYERYGFVPLETPAQENLGILLGKYGEDEKLIYRVLHRGETLRRVLAEKGEHLSPEDLSDQALRYDLTVPLARVVAQYRELPRFFKRYQIQPVWRADRPGKGRFREFYQCDVDITGTTSLLAEAEVCAAGCEVLERLGFHRFTLSLNHRELLRAVVRAVRIPPQLEGSVFTAIDKVDKIGNEGVRDELEQRGVDPNRATELLQLIQTASSADNHAVLADLGKQLRDEAGLAALNQLAKLLQLLQETPAGPHARIVPALARGLGYYTGPIFEASVEELGSSIAGGGRYDGLVGAFGKQSVPAVGLSLGLERILVVMAEREMFPELALGPQLLLCWFGVAENEALQVAHALRRHGLRVELYPEATKIGKQLQYADAANIPFAAIVGDRELETQTITIKHLSTGTQSQVGIAEVARELSRLQPA